MIPAGASVGNHPELPNGERIKVIDFGIANDVPKNRTLSFALGYSFR